MPVTPTYPGVYIEEIPSGVRTIVGVATSITAFIGRAVRGPTHTPVRIQNFGDFERVFGGLDGQSSMSYAVQQFFLNGGADAIIVRVIPEQHGGSSPRPPADVASKATLDLAPSASSDPPLKLEAFSEGAWGNDLKAIVDHDTKDGVDTQFNLRLRSGRESSFQFETFRNLSTDPSDKRFVVTVLKEESQLVRVVESDPVPTKQPENHPEPVPPPAGNDDPDPFENATTCTQAAPGSGNDGGDLNDNDVIGPGYEGAKKGLYALDDADLFNLLCIPPLVREDNEIPSASYPAALSYCQKRRAMLLVDPVGTWDSVAKAVTGVDGLNLSDENAAIFFPRLNIRDALQENRPSEFVPCGAVAGVMSRTDAERGVWKAPAGLDANLVGVQSFTVPMTDEQNGLLNPKGVNCLRNMGIAGNVVWGARYPSWRRSTGQRMEIHSGSADGFVHRGKLVPRDAVRRLRAQ